MSRHNSDGVRVCVTCNNRERGTFAPRPCAVCGRVLTPRFYDRDGLPRCELCPPDPGVDHVEMICDLIASVSPAADRDRVRELVVATVVQAARRRQVAWDLGARPQLLTGAAADASGSVRRLVRGLVDAGVAGVVSASCPFCGKTKVITGLREGPGCCQLCHNKTTARECVRCGHRRPVATRTPEGDPLCDQCGRREAFTREICSVCGGLAVIATHRGGSPICEQCHQIPIAVCSICGQRKPCRHAGSDAPRCLNCARRARVADCTRCGRLRPVGSRDGRSILSRFLDCRPRRLYRNRDLLLG
ncbi:hypothetical protein IFM12275_24730 [Nocardia sputorum]|uniref:hypothetical protein n=1 Tax=Nocardia sputorum TaxID=2984338 RepID=UPI00249291A8|nr:hypothetical protein [Nocardia sputorum]BDT92497.1 hypothetical protein IFM12275_24730 [Nocardia sputorum]